LSVKTSKEGSLNIDKKLNFHHQPYYSEGARVTLSRRAAALVALALATFFALGSVAVGQAAALAPHSKPAPPTPELDNQDSQDDENEVYQNRIREQYGEVEQVFLPPLVVTNPATTSNQLQPFGVVEGTFLDSANINPHENMPVDPKTIGVAGKTPADSFFQVATVAMTTMAAASVALGAFAIRRSIRAKNTPDSDSIYK
jgi:hypothetical protein